VEAYGVRGGGSGGDKERGWQRKSERVKK